jgi:hypothetical protein
MTDFTKTKMHFALALLGTMFAVHPYVERVEHAGFDYLGYPLEVFHAYGLTAALLALAIYCYAMAMMSERPASRIERVGNYFYAISILIFPLFAVLYGSHLLERWLDESGLLADWLEKAHLAWVGPSLGLALGVFWLVLSQVLAWRLRGRLGAQDRVAKVEQLANQEMAALNRAAELQAEQHYDLGVIEGWKALESRLRRVLLLRGLTAPEGADALIAAASRAGVLREPALKLVQDVRRQWAVAVSTEPLLRESAEKALQEVRDVLSTIPLTVAPVAQAPGPPTLKKAA